MALLKMLSALILAYIVREAPNVERHPPLKEQFRGNIEEMVAIHEKVADGRLVSRPIDVLLLSAVNYRETRMRLPAPEGDCRTEHRLSNVPTGSWPAGYKPTLKRVCHAVGPMQLNKGNTRNLPAWAEVQAEFKERDWGKTEESRKSPGKSDPLTVAQLAEPTTNVRLAYTVLQHWKNTCRGKGGAFAPAGVWLTAYRYGTCPPVGKNSGRFYIDDEAILRCELARSLAKDLVKGGQESIDVASLQCTYKDQTSN